IGEVREAVDAGGEIGAPEAAARPESVEHPLETVGQVAERIGPRRLVRNRRHLDLHFRGFGELDHPHGPAVSRPLWSRCQALQALRMIGYNCAWVELKRSPGCGSTLGPSRPWARRHSTCLARPSMTTHHLPATLISSSTTIPTANSTLLIW